MFDTSKPKAKALALTAQKEFTGIAVLAVLRGEWNLLFKNETAGVAVNATPAALRRSIQAAAV